MQYLKPPNEKKYVILPKSEVRSARKWGRGLSDYRGQAALVTLVVPHLTQALLKGPASILDLLTTNSQASIKAHHSSYRAL